MKLLKNATLTALATAAAMASTGAQAQSTPGGVYAEIGWTQITYREPLASIQPTALRVILGADVHPNLAVEGMLGVGLVSDTVRIGSVNVTGEIGHTLGFFIKPKTTVAPGFDVFARLGYVDTKLTASMPSFRLSTSGGDLAYGVGASYKINEQLSANVDYLSYYSKNGVTGQGMTFGLGIRF